MKRLQPRLRGVCAAFSLVEMLVSMSVMTLLLAVVSQITDSATAITGNSRRRMTADLQARLVFDCMANDFARILKRQDVDYYFRKEAGNDSAFFYSEAPGYYGSGTTSSRSGISLVGYRLNASHQLERLGKGLHWSEQSGAGGTAGKLGTMKYLTFSAGNPEPDAESTFKNCWPATLPDSTDPEYQVLGDQVYRLEMMFLLKDGTLSTTPKSDPTLAGLQNVAAIVVAVGILDSTSRGVVQDFVPMIQALPDAQDGVPILKTWNESSFLRSSGIPKAAASQLRIYQRYFYLH